MQTWMSLKNNKIILAKQGSFMIPLICHSGKRRTIKKHWISGSQGLVWRKILAKKEAQGNICDDAVVVI